MGYRKQYPFRNSRSSPTSVGITWSQQYSAYAIKWMDAYHFKEMTPVIAYMKSKPYGEYTYDPDNRVWYISDKYIQDVRNLLEAFGDTIFEVTFVEKPVGGYTGGFAPTVVSIDTWFKIFEERSGADIKEMDYKSARYIYRLYCRTHHPDLYPQYANDMSAVNEAWTELEIEHFKTRSRVQYETATSV